MISRKKNRLENYDYSQNGVYFITICTKDKKCLLSRVVGATIGRPPCIQLTREGEFVRNAIEGVAVHYDNISMDHYVIMPNHIHLLLRIAVPCGRAMLAPTVSRVVQQMKGAATKQIGKPIFQRSFHDHIIREKADYLKIWEYIDTNPAKWQLDRFYTEE